jgi:hypothetical protein
MTSLREMELRLGEEATFMKARKIAKMKKIKKFATANPSIGGEDLRPQTRRRFDV